MKFLSGTRNRSVTYTVVPARPVMDMTTGRSSVTPALRAKFEEHKFDSDTPEMREIYADYARQLSTGDTKLTVEDVRKMVERHLTEHPDFGRADGRGLFLDNSATLTEVEMRARGAQRRCIFMQDLGDETQQCSEVVEDPDSDYCPPHEAIVLAAVAGASA